MARTVKDHRLESRSTRVRLPPSKQPYWREISQGAHIGYFRGKRVGKWVARFRPLRSRSGYLQTTLGVADDVQDEDGLSILDFKAAQEKARSWFVEIARGNRPRTLTISDALDTYMACFSGKSVAATRAKVDAVLRPALGHRVIDELTSAEISKWHRDLANAPSLLRTSSRASERNVRPAVTPDAVRSRRSTANRYLTVLKAALNLAYREGTVRSDEPWRRVRAFQNVDKAKLRYLSQDEARRLVDACDGRFRDLVQAALLTGARYGDLRSLRVRDFDGASGTLMLPNPKSGRPYVVYLADEGARLITRLSEGKRGDDLVFTREDGAQWGVGHQRRRMQSAYRRSRIEPVSFHDLRRTYGAFLAMRGVPIAVVSEAMGHADERITRRHYAHLAPSYVGDIIRRHTAALTLERAEDSRP